jgi:cell division protein ZapA (FtsZ GTPase activity inhibitor)
MQKNTGEVDVVTEKYEITVAGRTFLVGSERGKAHVRTVAGYVEQRLQEIAHTVRTVGLTRISLMTAMTLAEELLDLSERGDGSR